MLEARWFTPPDRDRTVLILCVAGAFQKMLLSHIGFIINR